MASDSSMCVVWRGLQDLGCVSWPVLLAFASVKACIQLMCSCACKVMEIFCHGCLDAKGPDLLCSLAM